MLLLRARAAAMAKTSEGVPEQGAPAAAVVCYQQALAQNPACVEARSNLELAQEQLAGRKAA